eukprot:jgi/Undpi1/2225/HiC_scaffold_12.g05611.m1
MAVPPEAKGAIQVAPSAGAPQEDLAAPAEAVAVVGVGEPWVEPPEVVVVPFQQLEELVMLGGPEGVGEAEVAELLLAGGGAAPAECQGGAVASGRPAAEEAVSERLAEGEAASEHLAEGEGASEHLAVGEGASEHLAVGEGASEHLAVGEGASEHLAVGEGASEHLAVGEGAFEHLAEGEGASEHLAGEGVGAATPPSETGTRAETALPPAENPAAVEAFPGVGVPAEPPPPPYPHPWKEAVPSLEASAFPREGKHLCHRRGGGFQPLPVPSLGAGQGEACRRWASDLSVPLAGPSSPPARLLGCGARESSARLGSGPRVAVGAASMGVKTLDLCRVLLRWNRDGRRGKKTSQT